MTPTEYLETRFREYFPDLLEIELIFKDGDELILAKAWHADDPGGLVIWECEIGSDDDRYVFIRQYGQDPNDSIDPIFDVLTIPLMPES